MMKKLKMRSSHGAEGSKKGAKKAKQPKVKAAATKAAETSAKQAPTKTDVEAIGGTPETEEVKQSEQHAEAKGELLHFMSLLPSFENVTRRLSEYSRRNGTL